MVALDVTIPEAVAWFVYRLRKLQAETGIDGFKFDAGEPSFLEASERPCNHFLNEQPTSVLHMDPS